MTADVRQVRRLATDLRAAGPEAVVRARLATRKICADSKRDAQAVCPVDTGFLRGSITFTTKSLRREVVGEVGPEANYGIYVELGTSRMGPQPFMQPAFDRNAPLYERAIGQVGDVTT